MFRSRSKEALATSKMNLSYGAAKTASCSQQPPCLLKPFYWVGWCASKCLVLLYRLLGGRLDLESRLCRAYLAWLLCSNSSFYLVKNKTLIKGGYLPSNCTYSLQPPYLCLVDGWVTALAAVCMGMLCLESKQNSKAVRFWAAAGTSVWFALRTWLKKTFVNSSTGLCYGACKSKERKCRPSELFYNRILWSLGSCQ